MVIKIDGHNIDFFTSVNVSLKLDSIASTFTFQSRFAAQNQEHQEIFKPLQYKRVEIFNNDNRLMLTGTILNHHFQSDMGRHLVTISGYSLSGILEDVTIPVKDYPLESTGRSLKDIASRLCSLYNIGLVIADTGSKQAYDPLPKNKKKFFSDRSKYEKLKAKASQVFGRTSASPTETVKQYLAKLASQKNLLLSHTNKGEVLLFTIDYDAKPAYFFTKGNTISMDFQVNGQGLHSEINVVRQPSDENAGVSTADKAINTLIPKFRPTTKILTSGPDTDVKDGADNELAAELRGITLNLKLQGTQEFLNLVPCDIINVHNHYIYCYAYNRFMIETITFNIDHKEETTEISCLIPEAFTGGPKIRNIFFNHSDPDYHIEEHLNEEDHQYMNRKDIL
jgi:prophage tail gpP-like protein